MIVVCARESPRSAIISARSRKLSLYRRYQRTQSTMICLVKVPLPLKSPSIFVCARQLCRSTDLPTTMLCPSSSHQSQGCRHPLKADPMAPLAPIASMAVSGLPCTSQQKSPARVVGSSGAASALGRGELGAL